jgi:hypothetical protein
MIKYIVETTSSLRDYNGNCYHFARITSTKTKKSLVISSVGGSSNATGLLFRLKLANDWSELYSTEKWEANRDWQRLNKYASESKPVYEHDVTATMIRRLNRKTKQA